MVMVHLYEDSNRNVCFLYLFHVRPQITLSIEFISNISKNTTDSIDFPHRLTSNVRFSVSYCSRSLLIRMRGHLISKWLFFIFDMWYSRQNGGKLPKSYNIRKKNIFKEKRNIQTNKINIYQVTKKFTQTPKKTNIIDTNL